MKFIPYKNGWVREEFAYVDKSMINQCRANYSKFNFDENSVVMDWGMNVGGLGLMLLDSPIKQYIGVEANPDNYEVAVKNLGHDPRFTLISGAVTTEEGDHITLWMTNSKQAYCSGTTNLKSESAKAMRKKHYVIPTYHPDDLIAKYQPTHLKIDIEGEEYRILESWNNEIPDCVREFSLELHWPDRIKEEYQTVLRPKFLEKYKPVLEKLNYVKGPNPWKFLDKTIYYRNIWGLDCLFVRK